MKRRHFLSLAGAACLSPLAAVAQQTGPIRRVGVALALSEQDTETQVRITAFRKELERRGWIEGRNLRIDYRWAGADPKLAHAYAAELAAQKPDAIFAAPTSMAIAVRQETRDIPV